MSDDGTEGLTVIVFLGSVFSPYYAFARRSGRQADPLNHASVNVALYRPRRKLWAMTERSARHVFRAPDHIQIGASRLSFTGSEFVLDIEERTAPVPSHLRGQIQVHPRFINQQDFSLAQHGNHRWWPIAPLAKVEVKFERPAMRWSGRGYFDSNFGDAPLERDFRDWYWLRSNEPDHASILYEVNRRDGSSDALALRCDGDGKITPQTPPSENAAITPGFWRVRRPLRVPPGCTPRLIKTLEDSPFYTRSVIETQLYGAPTLAVHESLSLDRFKRPIVQAMLPFRIPRW